MPLASLWSLVASDPCLRVVGASSILWGHSSSVTPDFRVSLPSSPLCGHSSDVTPAHGGWRVRGDIGGRRGSLIASLSVGGGVVIVAPSPCYGIVPWCVVS